MTSAVARCAACSQPLPSSARERAEGYFLKALLSATELLGRALGRSLGQLHDSEIARNARYAETEELRLKLRLADEKNAILAARWHKIPERHRPHYTPSLRYRILQVKKLEGLSRRETGRTFQLAKNTIARWEQEASGDPETPTAGSMVKPIPPVRRFADVVRHVVHVMDLAGFGGNDSIARHLARAGVKLASRTIGRIRKEKRHTSAPTPLAAAPLPKSVIARYPNHLWMADLTEIAGFLRSSIFKLAVVYDVFSRMPLAARLSRTEPGANEIAELFDQAAARFGPPRHFVSDKGCQFTSRLFSETLSKSRVHHRFGAVGKTGSIALIERFWRTIKEMLALRTSKPASLAGLQNRLELGLFYYAHFRPHQALAGATPAEIYSGKQPAHLAAAPPPRARRGEVVADLPLAIAFLDPDRRLPILLPKAA